ncbi:GNAT family N-acetyltransferase [Erythrobacter sp.]|uniref:GNAT family N-acetyltransferase n=1 Tax=Erythrobacter sp. TaxID=1042 RepID=UPI001B2AB975|nr:N-acetyltransferase [Erythrobacter sp.]MBO6527618.1 N-acetyltransferase [Erythrobacter sp.]MBO6530127.1 N-acetyltransferase [Erythrobacter sp.]
MTAIAIRPEEPRDHAAIGVVTQAAFADAPHSDGSEVRIIDRLRSDGDLTLSLVAEDGERIVGHVAVSPVQITDGSPDWYGLGPIAVLPSLQRQGVGLRLMQRAIADMRMRGARGIVLLGDPAYYQRFGFEHDPQLVFPGPPAEYFQRLVIDGDAPSGTVSYAPAFG